MHKFGYIIAILVAIAVALAAYFFLPLATPTPEPQAQERVLLYYYDPVKDTDASGNVLCSPAGLVAVERTAAEATPARAVRLLLEGELTQAERDAGLVSEFPLPGLALAGSSLENGTLTLTFNDPENRTSGGSCRVTILRAQIDATAKQFPGVRDVRILPEELFQP